MNYISPFQTLPQMSLTPLVQVLSQAKPPSHRTIRYALRGRAQLGPYDWGLKGGAIKARSEVF